MGSLLVWALAAGSAVFWGLRLWAQPLPVPANATLVATSTVPKGDLSRLLGTDPAKPAAVVAPAPVADTRLTLLGVVSPRGSKHQGEAMALISVDGKPARTFRVGAVVDGDRVLQSVSLRGAEVGQRDGPALLTLNLPPAPAEVAPSFPGAPQNPPVQPSGAPPGLTQQPVEGGQPGAEGQVPGQDRTKLR